MSFIFQICYLPLCTSLRLCSFALAAGHWKKKPSTLTWTASDVFKKLSWLSALWESRVDSSTVRMFALSAASHRRVIYDNVVHAIKRMSRRMGHSREERRRLTIAARSNFVLFMRSKGKKNISTFSVVSFHSPLSFGLALKSESLIA